MNGSFARALASWPADPWLAAGLALAAAIYARGWWRLRGRAAARWPVWRLTAFVGGLGAIYVALASPISIFAPLLLSAHMGQHLLLVMVAPPLIWLGAPVLPLAAGLPRVVAVDWLGPFLRWPWLRKGLSRLAHPAVALPVFVISTWVWHAPRAYELALGSDAWHYAEHVTFLAAGLLFWYPVVRPYPARPTWSLWLLPAYLLLADVQNTALAALLTFSGRVLYPTYARAPRFGAWSPLDDQAAAGVLMWVPGSLVFLIPMAWIGCSLLFAPRRQARTEPRSTAPTLARSRRAASVGRTRRPFDLLALPFLGASLRSPGARLALRLSMFALAAVVVYDGLTGPRVAAMNLAGVLPWVHWRGVVALGLLAVGNISCMACPLTLPRRFTRRFLPAGRDWPAWLRGKWLAVALVLLFLFSYEAFALWDRPRLTAWIVVGYFVAALMVDSLFRDGAFCKYVCPIGQFNFVQSLVSPFEVSVRDRSACAACRTHDCLRGGPRGVGCATELFVPRKAGNLDCTLCLDCATACPQGNVSLVAISPLVTLADDRPRSSVGRFAARRDIAALVVVLVFGAFANAAGMVAPVTAALDAAGERLALGRSSMTALFNLVAIVAAPCATVFAAAALCRGLGKVDRSLVETASRYAVALVPIGFSMWLVHYAFHFLTSYRSIVPVTRRFLADQGLSATGTIDWACACCQPASVWLTRLELSALGVGMLASLWVANRMAAADTATPSRRFAAWLPWAIVIGSLYAVGVWIVFQPMEMRGTLEM